MPQHGPAHVPRLPPAGADLDGEVAVLPARLVREDLVAVELQHGAGRARPRAWVVERRHPGFGRERARAQREGVGRQLARVRARFRAPEGRVLWGLVVSGGMHARDGFDAAVGGVEAHAVRFAGGMGEEGEMEGWFEWHGYGRVGLEWRNRCSWW